MATSSDALRRRAACACLSAALGEEALIDALWLQHDSMRGDAVSDIIAYIDAVAARHLLDAATRKRLYEALFRALRQPEDTLPMDPWPMMQGSRPMTAPGPASPVRSPVPPPAFPAPAPAVPEPVYPALPVAEPAPVGEPVPAAALPLRADQPAHEAVFNGLAQALLSAVQQFHGAASEDFRSACLARLDRARLPADVRQQVRAGLNPGGLQTWRIVATAEQLSAVVHEFYVGLCESLGPVDADQVLMLAVRQAEQLPQARDHPPSRFL